MGAAGGGWLLASVGCTRSPWVRMAAGGVSRSVPVAWWERRSCSAMKYCSKLTT